MNPGVPFVRKLMLFYITKLSQGVGGSAEQGQKKEISEKMSVEDNEVKKKNKMLKGWVNEEWIHPGLFNLSS